MIQILLWLCLVPAAFASEIDGGEIGNAFVPYENILGRYSLQYPQGWQYFDLGPTTSFSDPGGDPAGDGTFFSLLADRFPGIRTMGELEQHIRFFHPDETWVEATLAGLPGFRNSRSPAIFYLFRGSEDLLSVRFRADKPLDEARVQEMLRSLKVE